MLRTMSVKIKYKPEKIQQSASKGHQTSSINKPDLVFIFLYLLAEFVPQFKSIEVMGPQWLYLSVLNLIVIAYILSRYNTGFEKAFEKISQNLVSKVFVGVFVLCGISIFFALNPIESLVVYSRLIITLIAFFNLSILISRNPKSVEYVFQAISIIAIFQCLSLLNTFLQGIKTSTADVVISNLTGNSGNKNVLAASLVIKSPLIIYCTFRFRKMGLIIINTLSLTLVILMIFILNARAAYLGFFIQLFIFIVFLYKLREEYGLKPVIRNLVIVLIPIMIGLSISQVLLSKAPVEGSDQTYTTLNKRLATLSDHNESSSSARLFFWSNTLKQIKETPITGCGYGNWKIQSVKYEYDFYNDFNYSKHAHNDFLQLTAESGIFSGLLFLSIFAIALFYTIRLWQSDIASDYKILSLISLMSIAGYFVDANFNFPAERPVMQSFFAFVLALNVVLYINSRSASGNQISTGIRTMISILSISLVLVSVYTSWFTYQSMQVQRFTHFNFGTAQPGVSWQDINSKFPSIPNIAENNIPINDIKAWYLFRAQKYDEALYLLNQDKNANPYSMSKEWLKASIFTSQGLIDSAHFYSKKGFFIRPRNLSLFNIVTRTSVPLKDTTTIQQAFKTYKKYREEPRAWKIYMRSLFAVNYDREELISLADSIAKVYPNDPEILHTRYFIRAGFAAMRKDFPEALENLQGIMRLYPNEYENLENIGLTYYFMQDYANAAVFFRKVVNSKVYNTGKSEFYLGNCLLKLGNKAEACNYLSIAANRNYPNAAILFNKNNCDINIVSK